MEAHLKLAEMYLYLKRYKDAIVQTNEVLKVDGNNAKAYFIKGYVYADAKDTAKAIVSYETCIEKEPGYYEALFELGKIRWNWSFLIP